jgi:putative membrane protein
VLITFAPRAIYGHAHAGALADQQLGGLIMLIVCPLTYILAAVVIVTRWLSGMKVHAVPEGTR